MRRRNLVIIGIILMFSVVGCGKKDVVVETMVETEKVSENIIPEVVEEETTEEVIVESTEISENTVSSNTDVVDFEIVDCTPTIKYTNTNSNIRLTPSKDGLKVDCVVVNTELTVNGMTKDGSWSRVSFNSLACCFIKSSLLSNHMQSTTSPSPSKSGVSSQQTSTSTPTPTPAQNDVIPYDPYAGSGTTDDMTSSGGTTGSNNTNPDYHGY